MRRQQWKCEISNNHTLDDSIGFSAVLRFEWYRFRRYRGRVVEWVRCVVDGGCVDMVSQMMKEEKSRGGKRDSRSSGGGEGETSGRLSPPPGRKRRAEGR